MEFITGVLLSACICMAYLLIKKPKPLEQPQESEEERIKRQELEEHISKMMNYDITQAYGGHKHD